MRRRSRKSTAQFRVCHNVMTFIILISALHPFIIILLTALHPVIVILLTALYPIHCHSLYTVYIPSANGIDSSRYGLSGSTSLAILLVYIFMAWPGRHRQAYYWYILSLHVQLTTFSPIIFVHVLL